MSDEPTEHPDLASFDFQASVSFGMVEAYFQFLDDFFAELTQASLAALEHPDTEEQP